METARLIYNMASKSSQSQSTVYCIYQEPISIRVFSRFFAIVGIVLFRDLAMLSQTSTERERYRIADNGNIMTVNDLFNLLQCPIGMCIVWFSHSDEL